MTIKNREIEYKYSTNLLLTEFKEKCQNLKQRSKYPVLELFGSDIFYDHPDKPDIFIRHRQNTTDIIVTIKKKIIKDSNIDRHEINIDYNALTENWLEKEEEFCKLAGISSNNPFEDTLINRCLNKGFKKSFKIFKYIIVYIFGDVTLSWYQVFNENLIPLEAFIEIEANEGYKSKNEAIQRINKFVGKLDEVKILMGNDKFIKQSLYELYKPLDKGEIV